MRTNNPGSFYGSFCKATDTFESLLGKISENLSGETVEKVTISSSSKVDSHTVPLG